MCNKYKWYVGHLFQNCWFKTLCNVHLQNRIDLVKKLTQLCGLICATFDLIVSKIDSVKKLTWCKTIDSIDLLFTDSTSFESILQQSSRSFSNRVDPSAIESILQQSSWSFSNRVDPSAIKSILQQSSRVDPLLLTCCSTTPTGHVQYCNQQSRLVYKLLCFTYHLRQSPVTVKAGRKKTKGTDMYHQKQYKTKWEWD